MAKIPFQTDQMRHDGALSELAPSGLVELVELFPAINNRVKYPLSLSVTGKVVTVGPSVVTVGPNGKKLGLPQLSSVDLGNISGTFDLDTGTGTGNVQSATLPSMTASYYVRLGFETRSDKKIYPVFGATAAAAVDAGAPGFAKGTIQAGELLLQDDGTGGQGNFIAPTSADITQFGVGGGGGSGSGVGTLNYVENYDGEVDAGKWITYNDGNSALPSDGTGGTVDPGFTITKTTTNPLRGKASLLITKPASDVRGHGVSTDLLAFDTIDDKAGLQVELDYETTGATGLFKLFLYNIDTNSVVTPTQNSINIGTGRFKTEFKTTGAGHRYRLIVHTALSDASAATLKIDDVNVNPIPTVDVNARWFSKESHGFVVGDIINWDGTTWAKAVASSASGCQYLGVVTAVPSADSFLYVTEGKFRTTSNMTAGIRYLSDTASGTTVATADQKIVVPVYVVDANNPKTGYFYGSRYPDTSELGDLSFRIRAISGSTAYLRGGLIKLDTGEVIASGATATEAGYKADVALSLATILGGTPANNTTYWLYVDRLTLTETALTDSGRKVWLANANANYKLLTSSPDDTDSYRFIEVGYIHSADTVNAWTGTGATFGYTPTRIHNPIISALSTPQTYSTSAITSASIQTLYHGLSGEPQHVSLFFYENSTGKKAALDLAPYMTDKSATQLVFDFTGLTFNSGDYVNVQAVYFPNGALNQIVSASIQFESGWYVDSLTTSVAHGLTDMDSVRGLQAIEWDTTTGRRRVVDGLIFEWDNTNIYLDWTGFSPSETLKYKIVAGGSPLPYAIPYALGGYTKFVGFGPGSYPTLGAALAGAVPGDSILVNQGYVASSTETVSVNDVKIEFMPGMKVSVATDIDKVLVVAADRVTVSRYNVDVTATGTFSSIIEVAGKDCSIDEARITVNNAGVAVTAAYNITATAEASKVYGFLRKTAGMVTSPLTDAGSYSDYSILTNY